MSIGTSDGEHFDDAYDQAASSYQQSNNSDYDYAGARAAGVTPAANGHWPDTYKLPNHITFSDESKYNDGGAGHWDQIDGRWNFTPGPTNLKTHTMDELRSYFKKYEPDSNLIEPQNDYLLRRPNSDPEKPTGELFIDRDHHVPLVASALMDEQGKMYGMAVDHRVNVPDEYLPHLALHEASELPHMRNLIAAGMSPTEAYHEAHDKIATPIETASVHAAGLDQDAYKQFFRDAASVASQPSDRERHPHAHTTVYGLDEAEGAYKTPL